MWLSALEGRGRSPLLRKYLERPFPAKPALGLATLAEAIMLPLCRQIKLPSVVDQHTAAQKLLMGKRFIIFRQFGHGPNVETHGGLMLRR